MLFQPSNIYPSTFSGIGAGTVDVTQGINVSWQVNGDTPMTAYQIKIYQNDSGSTLMYDSGSVSVSPVFEPHDKNGNATYFTAIISAAALSTAGIVNGYQYGYKMLITQWWGVSDYVEQTSASVFITRSTPTLAINTITTPVASNSLTITANYSQAQGDPISTVEWVFALAGSESTPIRETGAISTQVLSFDADGLITGNTYSIMCKVVTSTGMEASTGFVQFPVSYSSSSLGINYQLAQLKNSSAVYLSWDDLGSNKLAYPYTDTTKTTNGITFTVNGEGDVVATGTASADAYFTIAQGTISQLGITAGQKFIVTSGYSGAKIVVTETNSSNVVVSTITGNDPLQYIATSTTNTLKFSIVIPSGSVLSSGQQLNPMIALEDKIVAYNDLSVNIEPIQDLHGYASPWIGTDYDQQPYNFRAVSSSSISPLGNSEMGNIVGGTVAWNQLLKEMNSTNFAKSSSSGVIVSIADGVATVTVSVQYAGIINTAANRPPIPTGHKVLCSVDVKLSSAVSNAIKAYWNEQNTSAVPASAVTAWQTLANIISWDSTKLSTARVNDYRASDWDSYQVKNSVMFDLTAMFGSTIADYLYGLESGTAGAGIAKLKSWGFCTKPYYAYDAGSLQSVNTSAHKTYKADTTLLGNYALDSSLTLRGIPKLDANNNLYYDGDSYEADGTVTRKYGIVDLGTLAYTKNSGAWRATIPDRKYAGSGGGYIDSIIVGYAYDFNLGSDMTYAFSTSNNGYVWFRNDIYTTADAFKTAMSGVYLVYKLAAPTTETATSYAATQSIDPDGTEEYVDYAESQGTRDVAIPVGHYTNYANICPISGRTGLSVYVSPTQDPDDATVYNAVWSTQAGTVYHGTVDLVAGQLTADWIYKEFDGTEGWFAGGNYIGLNDAVDYASKDNNDTTQISNIFVGAGGSYANYNSFRVQTNKAVVVGNKNEDGTVGRWADATAFKSFLAGLYSAGTPFAVCYELATPITYQLTPTQVAVLTGTNNVWSTGDSVSVTYTKDTGSQATLSGAIVTFSDSNAVLIPTPQYIPGITGISIYRYLQGESALQHVYDLATGATSILDYFAPSQTKVSYLLVAHSNAGDLFLQTTEFTPTFWFYSILLCGTDSNGNYHVSREYIFKYGVETGAVSNNNDPTIQKNFTPYPNRQPISALYKTGKLSGYIGKTNNLNQYSDSISLQNAIYDISVSTLDKFIKSRKGDVIKVDTASSIQMKTEDNTTQQALKATMDWVEVGDSSDISIVSVPQDGFWPLA